MSSFVRNRYVHFPALLSDQEQSDLAKSVLNCHQRHSHEAKELSCNQQSYHNSSIFDPNCPLSDSSELQWGHLKHSKASMKLNLGLRECGGDLNETLPLSVKLSRRAFLKSAKYFESQGESNSANSSYILAGETPIVKGNKQRGIRAKNLPTKLTGLSLLYGPNAVMSPHYDSSTQPGQREEWLVMFTVGSDVLFRCNEDILTLSSGDALVMDSMSVLHGVEGIREREISNCKEIDSSSETKKAEYYIEKTDSALYYGLPLKGSRLGVLLWHGKADPNKNRTSFCDEKDDLDFPIDGFSNLFAS